MKALILAAGFGTRLRPLTWTLPKPLVPLCNRPLIAYAVENLVRFGIDEIIVNLHHLGEPIERFLRDEYAGRCRFSFSHEEEILGTGGAIRRVRPLLEHERDFFLVNGDTIQFPPYDDLLAARRDTDALAALTLRHPPEGDCFTAVYFEEGSRGHEVSRSRDQTPRNRATSQPRNRVGGRVTGFGTGTGEALMFSGSHCISARILRELPDREVSGIVEDTYRPLIAGGRETLAAIVDDGLWFDIGTPQRYLAASRALAEAMIAGKVDVPAGSRVDTGSIIDTTARISGTARRSTVGRRSVVEGDLDASFVWNDCRIARGSKLTSCIVGHGVEIAMPRSFENAVICRDEPSIPRDGDCRFENGLVIAPIA